MLTRRVFLVLALVLMPALAHAQAHDAQARGMIRSAMEDYQNLDIDAAVNRLHLALNLCGHNTCSPAVLARVHLAMGVVAVGGQNDANTGTTDFVDALRLDNTVEPDAMLVTPEITSAFNNARQRAGGHGGTAAATDTHTTNNTTTTQQTNNTQATDNGSGGQTTTNAAQPAATGGLLHTPVPEQLENTPTPVYVEPGPTAAAATHYVVHFRGLGMSGFTDLAMQQLGDRHGFGAEVPCGQVIRPNLEYYISAADDSGRVIATAGTAAAPVRVSIVASRTQPAPYLPGRMPPETCAEDCPPGMTGPQCRHTGGGGRGSKQLGDACGANSECAEGMHCQEGACASGDAGGGSGASTPHSDNFYRIAVDLGGGLTEAYLPSSDALPAEGYSSNPNCAGCTPDHDANDNPVHVASYAEITSTALTDGNGNPVVSPAGNAVYTYSCGNFACPKILGGLVPTGFVQANVRVNPFPRGAIGDRIGLGINLRFQPNASSVGSLTNLVIGGRLYFALNSGGFVRRGLVAAVFVGGGGGQMQAQPPLNVNGTAGHVASGLDNVNFGGHVEYGLGFFHIGAQLALNFEFPTFLFVADLMLFVGVHY